MAENTMCNTLLGKKVVPKLSGGLQMCGLRALKKNVTLCLLFLYPQIKMCEKI